MTFIDFMRASTGDPLWGAVMVIGSPEHFLAVVTKPRQSAAYMRLAAGGGIGAMLASRFFSGLPVPEIPAPILDAILGVGR